MSTLLFTRTLRSLFDKLLSYRVVLSMRWWMVLFLLRCRTLFCLSLNFTNFLEEFQQFFQEGLLDVSMTLPYQPLLPVWCHLKTCWRCTLLHHPAHELRFWIRLDKVLTSGIHHCWPPTRLHASHHHALGPYIQPDFSPPHCLHIWPKFIKFAVKISWESALRAFLKSR